MLWKQQKNGSRDKKNGSHFFSQAINDTINLSFY